MVVGHQSAEVRAAIQTPGIGFIDQAEQRSTGHALMVASWHARRSLDGRLVILYGDCPLVAPGNAGQAWWRLSNPPTLQVLF